MCRAKPPVLLEMEVKMGQNSEGGLQVWQAVKPLDSLSHPMKPGDCLFAILEG